MSESEEVVIGSRGEIYTTRELREKTGLSPGGRAIASVVDGKLVIEPKKTALSLIKRRVDALPIDPREFHEERRELAKRLES